MLDETRLSDMEVFLEHGVVPSAKDVQALIDEVRALRDTKREVSCSVKSYDWQSGFPTEGGMYLVELADSEMVVTPWNDGTGKNRDSWGDERRTGWCCLTDSRSTVKRWIKISTLAALPTTRIEGGQP